MILTFTPKLRSLAQIFPLNSGSLYPTTYYVYFKKHLFTSQNKLKKLSVWFSLSQRRILPSTQLVKSGNSGITSKSPFPFSLAITLQSVNNACDSCLTNFSWSHVVSPSLATLSPYSMLLSSPGTLVFIRLITPHTVVSVRKTQWRLNFLTFAVKSFLSHSAYLLGLSSDHSLPLPMLQSQCLPLVPPSPMFLWFHTPYTSYWSLCLECCPPAGLESYLISKPRLSHRSKGN